MKMKKIRPGFLLGGIAMLFSCQNLGRTEKQHEAAAKRQIEKANWLIGEWKNNSETEKVTEIWEKENDSVYAGKSYSLHNADTTSSERIRLEEHGDKLFYIPVVKNQNAGEVVKFTLVSWKANQLTFENPAHDFPQKISYSLITNDSLFAEISGMYKGKQQSEKFPMHRVR
jgi:hypothetical protein